ncbi:multicopper oxidase domain-containing protein [Okeania sp. SIO2B3]|uniref:multicopper oxidase domain-containing protein n=1 Tax=Okeania sp. SIO2B3 TaxID=2607784 RepID=UPI0013C1C4C4|nr:multicopper oxidase domain-containing protein [Okeania sp. SIO2B3]NET44471.1 multicopper oxidase domain-containing protein [Okeania sp. SIO2B3]
MKKPNKNYYYLASVTVPTASKSQLLKGLLSDQVCSNSKEGLAACLKSLKLGQLAGGEILPNPNTLASYKICTGEPNDTCVVSSSSDPDDKFEFIFNRGYLNPSDQDMVFTINGELYDGSQINKIVNVGTNQDWKLVNKDTQDHAFHIHQLDFIMTEVTVPNNYLLEDPDGRKFYDNYPVICDDNPATLPDGKDGSHCTLKTYKHGYRDTINLPANSEITVRIPFLNPFITGVFVYHCHILGHEDLGMMQNIKVVNPKSYIPRALRDKWFKEFQDKDNK